MPPQGALGPGTEPGDGVLRALVEVVGLPLDPAHAQFLEGVGEQQQLGLGVDGAAPDRAAVPGPADLQALVPGVPVHVGGPADGPAGAQVDDGEGDVVVARGEHPGGDGPQLLLRFRGLGPEPAPYLRIAAAGGEEVGEVGVQVQRFQPDPAAGEDDGGGCLCRHDRTIGNV